MDFNRAQLPPTPAPAAVHKSTTDGHPISASDRPKSEGRVIESESTDVLTSTVPTTPSTTTTSDDTHTGDHNSVKNVSDATTTCSADPRPRERPRINRSRPPDARVHPLAERPAKTYKPAKTTLPPVQLPPGRLYDAESFAFAAGGKPCSELDSSLKENLLHTTSSTARILNAHWTLSLAVSVQVQPHYCVYLARDSFDIRPIVNVRACRQPEPQSTPILQRFNIQRSPC